MRIYLLAILSFFLIISCKPNVEKTPELSEDDQVFYSGYVQSYPSGRKSKSTSIRVELVKAIDGLDLSLTPDIDVLKVRPKTKGELFWIDNKTLSFTPSAHLESDQLYNFELDLKMLYPDIVDNKRYFAFDIRTRKLSLYSYQPNLFPLDDKDPTRQQVEGYIRVSDETELDNIQKCLTAKQNGKSLDVEWTGGTEPLEYNYSIKNVVRSEEQSLVTISINGKPIGAESERELEVLVPALNVFEVTSVSLLQKSEQQVNIQFSDYLDEEQGLNGMVRLSNGAKIRTTIKDNILKVFPVSRQEGEVTVIVDQGIKNSFGVKLKREVEHSISFKKLTPQLAALSSGVIMPSSENGLVFPFKAVSLHAVQIRVVRVFEDNIGQFLQVNNLSQSNQLKRVGRLVHKSNIVLGDSNDQSLRSWNDYAIDLTDLMKTEPGALYRIKVSFTKAHTIRDCTGTDDETLSTNKITDDSEFRTYDNHNGYYNDDDDYYERDWLKDNDDPCTDDYYRSGNPNSLPIFQNVIATDLGIIAKRTKTDKLHIALTDLKSTKSLSGVKVDLYNLQNRIIQSGTTDSKGFAQFDLEGQPLYLVASDGKQKGYLKLDDGSSLSLSTFDVSGDPTQSGIKGFLYQERGVSRPGDSLYVTFILEDKDNPLPKDHPVVFELYDPKNQRVERKVYSSGVNNFYAYKTATDIDAPTGNWLVKAKVGGATFNKSIKIETVKPNRLKIKLDFPGEVIHASNVKPGTLEVKWLHGADAKNLKADVEMTLKKSTTSFKGYEGYHFDDASKDFESDVKKIFDGKLDGKGQASITPESWVKKDAPGILQASFKIRAFEEGGNFSVDRFGKKISPFESYVGVKVPKGKGWRDAIFSDETSRFEIATVDDQGNGVARKDMKVEIFNLRWSWWWERSSRNNIRSYVADRSQNLLQSKAVSTNRQGKGVFDFNLGSERYGRTLIRITDPISGHSTAQVFYTTYSRWWDDGSSDDIPGGAEMLTFKTDKTDYNVGETINVELPGGKIGRALISVENGTEVQQQFWVDMATTNGKISIPAAADMAPNAYLNITYIQPHGQVDNDRPIRLYGIQRINVTDPMTKLEPVMTSPSEIRPETDYELTIKERNGQAMSYTIAVVDDGLLDLTRFQTPQPWNTFYAQEALGVKTWDLYSDVMGAYGGTLTQLLALGGDEFADGKEPKKANRFKPVVKFIGPFKLTKGQTAKHTLDMPNYVGSVRAMVVAGNPSTGAYGKTDASIPVKKPLMVVTTLPRVLSPTETLDMPITVFAMDKKVKEVKVTIESNDLLNFEKKTQTIKFDAIGDQVVRMPLSVADAVGIGKVKVTVSGAGETATEEIELDVRLPNPAVTTVSESIMNANESKDISYKYFGVAGTNEGTLELSTIPSLNLEKRMRYLIRYPHGCVEQTTSAAFPQLYLADVSDMTNSQKDNARMNVEGAIKRLKKFQTIGGGFGYWPGDREISHWGSNYAGHFLVEAKRKGYLIPYGMLEQWIKYQSSASKNWSDTPRKFWNQRAHRLDQAYRLYALALAEKPELGAMNRLRGIDDLENIVKWKLASAYALAGKPEVAKELIARAKKEVEEYTEYSYTYGSHVRDRALILETLTLLNDRTSALSMIKEISNDIGSNRWYSTQTTAVSLMAISKFIEGQDDSVPMDIKLKFGNGKKTDFQMVKAIKLIDLPKDMGTQNISVTNDGGKELFARVILSGTSKAGEEKATASKIAITTTYTDLDGKALNLNSIPQGTDINVTVKIKYDWSQNRYFREMALNQIMPAGWEIRNTRMDQTDSVGESDRFEYQDVRDDRVMTYFSLPYNQSKTFKIQVNASYAGRYYLPPVQCEAMYDNTISASTKGQWINVVE